MRTADTSSLLATLTAARALITDASKWTKGADARDAQGGAVRACNPLAVCWCVYGAVEKVGKLDPDLVMEALANGGFEDEIVGFNDRPSTTHAHILAMFDRAIARATP